MCCGWEGRYKCDVTLTVCNSRSFLSTHGLGGLRVGDEHPAYARKEHDALLPLKASIYCVGFVPRNSAVILCCSRNELNQIQRVPGTMSSLTCGALASLW